MTAAALASQKNVMEEYQLAVDRAMLKLEEVISRDEFRQEILASIREARVEFKSRLLGTQ